MYQVDVPKQPESSAVCGAECFLTAGAALDDKKGETTVMKALIEGSFNPSWMSAGSMQCHYVCVCFGASST